MPDITPVQMWMGWTNFETGEHTSLFALSRQQTTNMSQTYKYPLGYGEYQFTISIVPDREVDALYTFIQRGKNEYPSIFSDIADTYMGNNFRVMYDRVYYDRVGFYNAFKKICEEHQSIMQYVQDEEFILNYWNELLRQFPELQSRNLSPYEKGSLASWAIRDGPFRGNNAITDAVTSFLNGNVKSGYDAMNVWYPDTRWMDQYNKMVLNSATGSNIFIVPGGDKPIPPSPPYVRKKMNILFYMKRRNI